MEIVLLDKQQVIEEPYITWIRNQHLMFESPMSIISKIHADVYKVYVAMDDYNYPHGMVVCKFDKDSCVTVIVYAKNKLLALRDAFYERLKSMNIRTVKTFSHQRSEAYERLIGMKHMYSYYEKEL